MPQAIFKFMNESRLFKNAKSPEYCTSVNRLQRFINIFVRKCAIELLDAF